ncbi:hypothetical protein GCM10020369_00500 [Cryptosporangium minutisporangium]|uniref:Uncharacterized protein n=1 Tax=Cryptosporangium minutisporangium TaxID=113569 RepID=A0ABP6SQG8_9ACTN
MTTTPTLVDRPVPRRRLRRRMTRGPGFAVTRQYEAPGRPTIPRDSLSITSTEGLLCRPKWSSVGCRFLRIMV